MGISCAVRSRPTPSISQHSFRQSVQFRQWVGEYKRALCAPFHLAAYGSRKSCPDLVMLAKNVERETNKVAETTIALSLGALSLAGIDEAMKAPKVLGAILSAQSPTSDLSLDRLQQMETELESELNPLQVQYIMGDRSTRVKMQLLEKFERYREVLDQIIAKLRKDVYGERR